MKLNAIKQIFNIYNKYMMDLDIYTMILHIYLHNDINIYTMILNMI